MTKYFSGSVKYVLGWITVFAIRIATHPLNLPNIEPVMATMMPFSKRYGAAGGFIFAFLSIVLFDLALGKAGQWTLITGIAYGLLGTAAYYFLRNKNNKADNYVLFAVIGTVLYDAVTGLSIGPLFFGQPFMDSLIGQIPFTLWHLAGNIIFSALLSPILYRWVVENHKLEVPAVFGKFSSQTK